MVTGFEQDRIDHFETSNQLTTTIHLSETYVRYFGYRDSVFVYA